MKSGAGELLGRAERPAREHGPLIPDALVVRAQTGEPAALAELATHVRPLVQRYAMRFVSDQARAEDLAQTTLMKAFTRLADVRAPEAFCAWLLRITRNECLNELARQRHAVVPISTLEDEGTTLESTSVAEDPEEALMRTQLQSLVRRVAEGLPDHYRRTLILRALEDRSYEEISVELDVPIPVARLWYCRARKRFRAAFVEAMVARRGVPTLCQEMGSAIAEMIEGTLPRADRDRVHGHLVDCHVCRQTEDELRNTAFRAQGRALLFGLGLVRLPLRGQRVLRRAVHSAGHVSRTAFVAGVGSATVATAGAAAVTPAATTAGLPGNGPAAAVLGGGAAASEAGPRAGVPVGAVAGSGWVTSAGPLSTVGLLQQSVQGLVQGLRPIEETAADLVDTTTTTLASAAAGTLKQLVTPVIAELSPQATAAAPGGASRRGAAPTVTQVLSPQTTTSLLGLLGLLHR